ncbi:Uncharacterized protein FWK35_00021084, partial [Aphis craccivora]
MLCVFFFLIFFFFLSVYMRTFRNNVSISNFGGAGKNQKKIKEKRKFLRKTSFRQNRFFYMVVIQKLITVNTRNFHQIFMSVLSIYNLSIYNVISA